jgi:hypothetical protein
LLMVTVNLSVSNPMFSLVTVAILFDRFNWPKRIRQKF